MGLLERWSGSFLTPKASVCTFSLQVKQVVDQKAGELPERLRVGGRDVGQGGARLGRWQHSFHVLLSNVCMAVLGLTFLTFCMKLRSKVHGNRKLILPVKLRLVGNVPFTLSVLGICLSFFPVFHFSTFFHVLRCSMFPRLKFLQKF